MSYKIGILRMTLVALFIFNSVESCNEALCVSVVSKCMLTLSCKCHEKNSLCVQECFTCLGDLFMECCSCIDMCPKPINSGNELSTKSHVEDFHQPLPDLFQALMAEPDLLERWRTFTYPVNFDILFNKPTIEKEILNCTVAFMSQCMSWNKCKSSCQSTGASKYRWFHDGCCECIGHTCINYGISQSRCKNCPAVKPDIPKVKSTFLFDDKNEIDSGI